MMPDYHTIVVGGGFFGCCLAGHTSGEMGQRTLLVEVQPELLQRASYFNQARVHNGYHYPRSYLTALRSRVNFPRFMREYRECIVEDFEKYYAIPRKFSKVTAAQFQGFCRYIGAPLKPAPRRIQRLFNEDLVESVFLARETAFDAVKLKQMVARNLRETGVEVRLRSEVVRVSPTAAGALQVEIRGDTGECTLVAQRVLNCTYSRLNYLLVRCGLSGIPLKHEITEMALVEMPEELRACGITLMCGPFFSIMPFPPRGLHVLSHVRYTPHAEWYDEGGKNYRDPYAVLDRYPRKSSYVHMIRDASRYVPLLGECRYVDSLWEVKTVLPKNECDDGRPILLKPDFGLQRLTSVMGSKIDNVFDVLEFFPAPSRA